MLISEIGSNYYSNDVAWFEVHNPTDHAINLSTYALRSSHLDSSSGASSHTPTTFQLPVLDVPPRGYVIVASRVYDTLQNNKQVVYVNNGHLRPYWSGSGSLELINNEATADFVRFGSSKAEPLSESHWTGNNAPALPFGATEHGKSAVRLVSRGMVDTNSASDWSQVNFATPAGVNDVEPGVTDSDRDGIPDSAKVSGGTYAGIDLYAMGARRGQKDLFIEIDYMNSTDPGVTPRQEALQKLVDAFAQKNVAVHIDAGSLYSAEFNPAGFNLGSGESVKYASCVELKAASETVTPGCSSLYDYKSHHFDVRRKFIFHYTLFANSQNADGRAGSSGIAEIYGNDLIVTLGAYGFQADSEKGLNLLINLQASTLMHELGHNLGLQHGGNEEVNYKPNHYSVMNYMYQFAGLSATPNTVHAAERYYLTNNLKGKTYCNLVENSPCTSSFKLSFSDGSSADLDENSLWEPDNIGRGSESSAYADWNADSLSTAVRVKRNLNPQTGAEKTVLRDYDEWSNLLFPFSRGFAGSNTGASLSAAPVARPNPMSQHAKRRVQEDPLPRDLHAAIHKH